MYAYVIAIQSVISEKHANNEEHYDEEDEIDVTYHLKRMCFVADSIEKALKNAKTYDFGEPVEWIECVSEKILSQTFELGRQIRPDLVSITEDIGYILENPKRIRDFVTITQVPLLD